MAKKKITTPGNNNKNVMKALILKHITDLGINHFPLELVEMPVPKPGATEMLIRIATCGICHTELDEIEGRIEPAFFPIIPGHQAVGTIVETGASVTGFQIGNRVGVGWIYSACGACEYCRNGLDNLCVAFKATGKDVNGGYAEFMVATEQTACLIPDGISNEAAAPMLCAGAIGYRSLMLTGMKNGDRIGLTGFGASGHLVLKLIRFLYPDSEIFVFARSPDEQKFALALGAIWSGNTEDRSPDLLQVIIDTTPVWKPVIRALENLKSGGRLVVNAIRKENHDRHLLQQLDYPIHLWMEKEIKSVANVSRQDITGFLAIAKQADILPAYQCYTFNEVNQALLELKNRQIKGAKVLKII